MQKIFTYISFLVFLGLCSVMVFDQAKVKLSSDSPKFIALVTSKEINKQNTTAVENTPEVKQEIDYDAMADIIANEH